MSFRSKNEAENIPLPLEARVFRTRIMIYDYFMMQSRWPENSEYSFSWLRSLYTCVCK